MVVHPIIQAVLTLANPVTIRGWWWARETMGPSIYGQVAADNRSEPDDVDLPDDGTVIRLPVPPRLVAVDGARDLQRTLQGGTAERSIEAGRDNIAEIEAARSKRRPAYIAATGLMLMFPVATSLYHHGLEEMSKVAADCLAVGAAHAAGLVGAGVGAIIGQFSGYFIGGGTGEDIGFRYGGGAGRIVCTALVAYFMTQSIG